MQFDSSGQPVENKNIPVITFFADAIHDEAASKREGRPIYRDVEMVRIQFPADRQRNLVRPANAEWKKIKGQKVTYAERFPEQYARFKEDQPQIVEGTPLSEAPFLTAAQRATLKHLQVYTVEQLASLSGQPLKNVGSGGMAMQQAAQAYLDNAKDTANTTAMAQEIESLKQTISDMQATTAAPATPQEPDAYAEMSDDDLKALIKDKSGAAPRGQPSRETLIRMARELEQPEAA